MFITALFTIARTWNQPRCPLADKWIRKLWYIYTMEYYSVIRRNAFESFLMISSVQFSRPVMSNSLQPHELQHARPSCPSPTPGVHANPCPLCQWCHPTLAYSLVPFSSCPRSFPASGSFPMSQLFTLGGQSIGVSASTSVLPMNTQDWFPLGWICWISL